MASITSTVNIIDRMSAPIYNIISAVDSMVNAMDSVNTATAQAFDSDAIFKTRSSVGLANTQLDEMVQKINQTTEAQTRHNNSIQSGNNLLSGMVGKMAAMAGAFMGVGKLVNLSDQMTMIDARLNLTVDDGGSLDEYKAKIMQSANDARAPYMQTADMISKLGQRAGDAFAGNDETIRFAENLNKSFVIAGASQQEIGSATLQLTQALGSGVLRGEEFNAIFEAAPNIIQNIADYMDVPIGQIRNMASEGQITADIVKNAMFGATDSINEQFNKMPMTWAQVWNRVTNQALEAFQPVLKRINSLANDGQIQQMVSGVVNAFAAVANAAVWAIDIISQVGGFVADNWSMLAPIIVGVAAALAVLNSVALVSNGIKIAAGLASFAKSAFTHAEASATAKATAAQWGFNTALLACPITWVVVAVIALIAVILAIVVAVNKAQGVTVSATGVICGAFAVAGAVIANTFGWMWNFIVDGIVRIQNLIAAFANFFGNVMNDSVGSVCRLFFDMVDTVLNLLQSLASAIDTMFGSNLAGAVQGWRDGLGGWVDATFGKGEEIMATMTAEDMGMKRIERIAYSDAFSTGYDFGEKVDSGMANAMEGIQNQFDNITNGVYDIADNTSAMADSLEVTEDELKFMRDVAEQEVINRFTTAEVRLDMTNNNNISSNMDLDGMVNYFATGLQDAIQTVAEGVHE